MRTELRPALLMLLWLSLLTGVAYPVVVTVIARAAFPSQAAGSLIRSGDRTLGSRLVGQAFQSPRHFWGRLSATGPTPYNAAASSGSNYGARNPALRDAVAARVQALRDADPEAPLPVPVDLVTASASGLDPHISPAAADYQVRRVARARGMGEAELRALVQRHTTPRTLGLFGEPVVHVLELNLALDAATSR